MAPTSREFAARVLAVGEDVRDSRVLRRRMREVIGRVVPYTGYSWLLTDPGTTVGTSPLAEVPCPDRLPELIRLRYTTGPRWATLDGAACFGTTPPSAWRDLVTSYGVRDVATVAFRDCSTCWGFLDLWRDEPFRADELQLLASLGAPVGEVLRRSQASALAQGGAVESPGPAVLVLGSTLDVRGWTEDGERVLRRLLPTEAGRRPVPAGAYNAGAQLLALEQGVDDHAPWARVHLEEGGWLSFRAARFAGESGDIAVTIEPLSGAGRLDLFGLAHRLSARELDVLRCLAEGDDTRRVAGRLHISGYTVQDHLKSVAAKTGLRSRGALVAAAVTGS